MNHITLEQVLASLEMARKEQYVAAAKANALEILARNMMAEGMTSLSPEGAHQVDNRIHGLGWEGLKNALAQKGCFAASASIH